MSDVNFISRYVATEIINFKGIDTFGLYAAPSWIENLTSKDLNDFYVTNDLDRRPDLIAKNLYGSPKYFWILFQVNKPPDPLSWPKTGQVIKYPLREIVSANV